MSLYVKFNGRSYMYCPFIFYDQPGGTILSISRELWGFPGKLAHIELNYEQEQVLGYAERPKGKRIATVTIFPEANAKLEELAFYPPLNFRLIPSADGKQTPDVAQLVELPILVLE